MALSLKNPIGLYIHVPFCKQKCSYCDFYSLSCDSRVMNLYTDFTAAKLSDNLNELNRSIDTVYFGGGTPSVLGGDRISRLLSAARSFVAKDAEITVECNASSSDNFLFEALKNAGVNRLSFGLQSAVNAERRSLGRLTDSDMVRAAVLAAKQFGFTNISLDIMLGIPGQTMDSRYQSIEFCKSLGVQHISAYILKVEENTPLYNNRLRYDLPDENMQSDFYLYCCEQLNNIGFNQYEISNFSLSGFESKHNLKYWNCDEYLGIGPAAHSFIEGKRFYYERDLQKYLSGCEPVFDDVGGSFDEYAMLRLRLSEGLKETDVLNRFGYKIPDKMRNKCAKYIKNHLLISDETGIRMLPEGFLLSNSIIADLLI